MVKLGMVYYCFYEHDCFLIPKFLGGSFEILPFNFKRVWECALPPESPEEEVKEKRRERLV
jgi:hypothetical protein